jgi:DNA modification methylase
MNPQQVKIDFNKNPVYEGGATLLALLACPANGRSENRNAGLHASLCGKALWAYHLSNPENAIRTTVNLQHVFRDAKVIDRETNFVARRLGERLVAGRMAIPFLQKAELGCQPQLPSAIKRLSVNQMAEFVLDDIGHADSNNVKRRVWAPSRPVIHLAAAAPPYNVPIDGHVSGLGQIRHREFVMAAGEMTPEGFAQFLEASLGLLATSSHPASLVYVCMDWRHIGELLAAARANALKTINLCVWTKPNAGMGSFYRSQHELVFVFKSDVGPYRHNVQLGRYGRNRTNVWAYSSGPGFGRAGEEGQLSALHPTVKPVAMVADAILDSSRDGDIVLDPFLGSGTTLMAAERTRRRCHGLELDRLYVDVIVRRWQAYTGASARHALTGAGFDEIVRAREQAR